MATFRYDVFLSHSSVDKPKVEELAWRLKQTGIEPFLDKWNLIPGQPWQEVLEEALSRACLCRDHRVRLVRTLAPRGDAGCAGAPRQRQSGQVPGHPGVATKSETAAGPQPSTDVPEADDVGRVPEGSRRRAGVPPPALRHPGNRAGPGPGQAVFEGECPYRGLEVFEERHARFFFGREAQVDWLLSHRLAPMAESSHAKRFLAILGPSGSGKSSLARAGLIPALRAGKVEGSSGWPIVVFRPGPNPLESLGVAFDALGRPPIRQSRSSTGWFNGPARNVRCIRRPDWSLASHPKQRG